MTDAPAPGPGADPTEPFVADDAWDPLHDSNLREGHWTTTNLGEAVPGVVTPLALAHWGLSAHQVFVGAACSIGIMSRAERDAVPPPHARVARTFYGRISTKLDYTAMMGDRLPGMTGEEALSSLLGKAPEGIAYAPTSRRYPILACRFPYALLTIPRRLHQVCAETDRYWRAEVLRIPTLDLEGALAALHRSRKCYHVAMGTHLQAMFASFKPVFDLLERLVQEAGTGDIAILSGTGGAEMEVVRDIWGAARGTIGLADVVRAHGFHGPAEGEVSSVVWRDDPTPLENVLVHYRALPDSESPARLEAAKSDRMASERAKVLAAVHRRQRPASTLLLNLARERIPDRGRGKRAFLQTIDVGRMAARRAGEHLVAAGVLADREDVFYLLDTELEAPLPADVRELVARRRERRALYQTLEFEETTWTGLPRVRTQTSVEAVDDCTRIEGTGASAGVVEGLVRVVTDPAFEDVEPGEILVAPTTDPSWCSIMFVSAALIVDLGGMLSHAAVVARELGLPCVVNTKDATRRLRTGDRVRVDGGTGTVEVLSRA